MATWRTKGHASGKPAPGKPVEPQAVRYYTSETTTEALVVRLQQNPQGLLVARDELSGWLGSHNAYKRWRGGAR